MEEKISVKIRQFRRDKGITLKELSDRTQLSVSFLSQVERGLSSMAVTSLRKIADALGVQMKDLVDVDEEKSFVNKKGNQILSYFNKSYINYVRLSGKFEGRKLESVILTIRPNCYDNEEIVHEGEEFYYVIKGRANFVIDETEYSIKEGETIHFPSSLSHKTINKEDEELVMLCVTTPTIF